MAHHYFDTSGLVKLYIHEQGSEWVRNIAVSPGKSGSLLHDIASSNLAVVEIAATFSRLRRMKMVTDQQISDLWGRFSQDQRRRFNWIRLDDDIVYAAAALTQRHPLRGYDAVHLASALAFSQTLVRARLGPATFVSADEVLCAAALAEGMEVENPNDKS